MSIFRPAANLFSQFFKFQQLAPISTASNLFAKCVKKPANKSCNRVKPVGCQSRKRNDCHFTKPKGTCEVLQVPDPSYHECIKRPKPPPRFSECTTPKLPPKLCIKENKGTTLDACHPRTPPRQPPCKPRKSKGSPKPQENCGICDSTLRPFKRAGPSEMPEMSCPPRTSSNICEPTLSSLFGTPHRNYSTKCKEKKKKKDCFTTAKLKKSKKVKIEDWASPVSCKAKGSKQDKCEQATCGPSFVPCKRPNFTNQHKCPKRIKKPRMQFLAVTLKKRKIVRVKKCKKPKSAMKFSCKPPRKIKKVEKKGPPTPTRCPCFKPIDYYSVDNEPVCKKMPGAVEPDCKKGGKKAVAVCYEQCKNK